VTNKIIVPVDFSAQTLFAIGHSYHLARIIQAEIVLLYVHEQPGIFAGLFNKEQHNEILSIIDQKLAELAGKSSIVSGLTVSYRLEKGRIYSKIIDVANEIKAKYIVMGTQSQDEGEKPELRVGANTSKVIRSAICPVITLNSRHDYPGCHNILLPIDLTKETSQKVTRCIEIAKIYGAGIKVVTAVWKKNDPELTRNLFKQGEQVITLITAAGIACSFELVESPDNENTLVPTILNYASQQGDIDLILVLTQQEIGIVEYFVGSHAQEFIRLSEIPVMSIIPKRTESTSIFS